MKIIIIVLLSIFSFENIERNKAIVDFRDQYCGNYICKRRYYSPNYTMTKMDKKSSSYTVNVSKHINDSTITITTQEGNFNLKYKNNEFSGIVNETRCWLKFKASDSVFINIKTGLTPVWSNYYGKK
jgi:hypothetical protein